MSVKKSPELSALPAQRPPFLGVLNIVRFNCELFALALFLIAGILALGALLPSLPFEIFVVLAALAALPPALSLLVSWYVYDLSGLYTLSWIHGCLNTSPLTILNIHAGFDEFSSALKVHFPEASLQVIDFYDPVKHTERSIKRARRLYPSYPGTVQSDTQNLGLKANSIHSIFLILALHEIRDSNERLIFLTQLRDSLSPGGRLIVVEHARDLVNFLAYSIGFFHFLPVSSMDTEFRRSEFKLVKQTKLTPFLRIYILERS